MQVLTKIAANLPAPDLRNLRRTSNGWNAAFATEHKKKDEPITLSTASATPPGRVHSGAFGPVSSTSTERKMEDFTALIKSSLVNPCSSFRIVQPPITRSSTLNNFFFVAGHNITRLDFGRQWIQHGSCNIDRIRKIIYELAPELVDLSLNIKLDQEDFFPDIDSRSRLVRSLPKLKRLQFDAMNDGGVDPDICYDLLVDLLQNAPELESLSFGTFEMWAPMGFPEVGNLKKLTMNPLGGQHIETLLQLANRKQNPVKLQGFSAWVDWNEWGGGDGEYLMELLHKFLRSQAATLQSLDIYIQASVSKDYNCGCPALRFPCLPELHTFELTRDEFLDLYIQYEGKTLGAAFPKLDRFVYEFPADKCVRDSDEGDLAHAGLSDLRLKIPASHYGPHGSSPLADFYIFAGRFSALTKLDVEVLGEPMDLHSVWTAWPTLTELKLRYGNVGPPFLDGELKPNNIDELLTGIKPDRLRWLTPQLQASLVSADGLTIGKLRELQACHKTKPGLSDLKHLRRFVLYLNSSNNEKVKTKISDFGGYFGLALASPQLQHMEVRVGDPPMTKESQPPPEIEISEECRRIIGSAFHPFALIILSAL